MSNLPETCVNTLRFLAVDAVERARSGHPGMPLGAAPAAFVVWDRLLRHNPRNPLWFNRDRFILSAGHGCALLYALLHMTGYDVSIDDLKSFRQWGSKTPGHPEHGLVPGVEATSGPLGQGFAMAVGMAIAERFLAAGFNRGGLPVVDHFTYALVSDGDLMEGVSSEAASLAGTLGLGKLICLYDENRVTIEGTADLAFTEDVAARFTAYGWHIQRVGDGNDLDAIERAVEAARAETLRPSLVAVRTHLGYGSPKQDRAEAHGEALGPEAAAQTKQALGWPLEPEFLVPDEARRHMRKAVERGGALEAQWQTLLTEYRRRHPAAAQQLADAVAGNLPDRWQQSIPVFDPKGGPLATREASGRILNALAAAVPSLIGGSADLAPSTKTLLEGQPDFSRQRPDGRNLRFGVREHAAGAIANGLALHGGLIPYASTFLVFSDYMRPALRLAAMMQTHAIFIFSHDSIALGEDGPTHQPVEHLASLRAIPGLTVFRPADANETAACWRLALERRGPSVLALSRQRLPVLDPARHPVEAGAGRGAYLLGAEGKPPRKAGRPDILLLATGSEVHLALEAAGALKERGLAARVASMPSLEVFAEQPEDYRQSVLIPGVPRLAIEAASPLGWHEYVGDTGTVIGLERFGASAPGPEVYRHLGFNVERVVAEALRLAHAKPPPARRGRKEPS